MSKGHLKVFIMTVIVMAFFALIGTTYAYFEVKIIENENEKSLEAVSKYLAVEYSDGKSTLTESYDGYFLPGDSFSKTFTVKNTGTDTSNFFITLRNVTNEFTRAKDLTYELVLINSDGTEETLTSGIFPIEEKKVIYREGEVAYQETKTFKLTISYLETTESQNEDINKNIEATIDIEDASTTLNRAEEGTLLYAINRDNEVTNTLTIPGREPSAENEAVLSATEDDYGESYYFRGNVTNNYVTYSGMCWRIVRVQGNGDIKLVLADREHPCGTSNGYKSTDADSAFVTDYIDQTNAKTFAYNYNSYDYQYGNSDVEKVLSSWAGTKTDRSYTYYYTSVNPASSSDYKSSTAEFTNEILDQTWLSTESEWCIDGSEAYDDGDPYYIEYGPHGRLNDKTTALPTLKCDMTGATKYTVSAIGILSADEIAYAGSTYSTNNNYYLLTNATANDYWTMSPYNALVSSHLMFNVSSSGSLKSSYYINEPFASIRPAIILKKAVLLNEETDYVQDGTQTNPYVIKEN